MVIAGVVVVIVFAAIDCRGCRIAVVVAGVVVVIVVAGVIAIAGVVVVVVVEVVNLSSSLPWWSWLAAYTARSCVG